MMNRFTLLLASIGLLFVLSVSGHGHGHGHGHGGGIGHGGYVPGNQIDRSDECQVGGNYPMHGDHEGNGDSCWQLQYSGGFAPNEFVRFTPEPVMDGVAVRILDAVEETAFPAGQCFDKVRDARFSTIWRSVGTDTTWGENLQNGASNVDLSSDWGCTANRQLTYRCALPVIEGATIQLFCVDGCDASNDLIDVLSSGTVYFASGFENDVQCLRAYAAENGLPDSFNVQIGADNEADTVAAVAADSGSYAFLRGGAAPANATFISGFDGLQCSFGYGPLLRKDDEAIADAIDCGMRNLSDWVYAKQCCAPFFETDLEADLAALGFGGADWFDRCFDFNTRSDGGPQLPSDIATYQDCCHLDNSCM